MYSVIRYLCTSIRTIWNQLQLRGVKAKYFIWSPWVKEKHKIKYLFQSLFFFFYPEGIIFCITDFLNWCMQSIPALAFFDDEITFSTLLDCMRLLEVENIAQVIINLIHNILKLYCGWQRAKSIVEFPSALEQWLWWIALTLQISEAAVACLIKERIGERVIKASKQQWQWAELPDRGHSMKNGSFTIPINQLYLV